MELLGDFSGAAGRGGERARLLGVLGGRRTGLLDVDLDSGAVGRGGERARVLGVLGGREAGRLLELEALVDCVSRAGRGGERARPDGFVGFPWRTGEVADGAGDTTGELTLAAAVGDIAALGSFDAA